MSVRILIVDDSQAIRASLRALLAKHPEFEVVGEALDGDEVPARVAVLDLDLVIMDVQMARVGGIEATRRLCASRPNGPKVLIASLYAHDQIIAESLRAGAAGYVLKTRVNQDLAAAIRRALNGGVFVSTPEASTSSPGADYCEANHSLLETPA